MSGQNETRDEFDVRRTMAHVPVQRSVKLSSPEYSERLSTVLNLFDIAAQEASGGVEFARGGVQQEDQPLLFALISLMERRFGDSDPECIGSVGSAED